MKLTTRLFVFGLALTMTLGSCVSSKKYNTLLEEKESLAKSLAESQEAIKKLEEENAMLIDEKDRLSGEVADMKADLEATKKQIDEVKQMVEMKEKELNSLKMTVENAFADYESMGLEVTGNDDRLYISMPEKVLFRSGSASLDRSDREVLGKLAEILTGDPELEVIVEGHTDSKKMIQGARYADNWELSVARAVSVTRELVKQGVNPEQITAAGSGEYSPVAEGDSAEAREKNRRTEFILQPKVDALYESIKG
jgi:chemotaxis protein MotB